MTNYDLVSDEGLRHACAEVWEASRHEAWYLGWKENLTKSLEAVRAADRSQRATLEFQRTLWEENHVSDVGQGSISIDTALDNAAFRDWIADISLTELPESTEQRVAVLTQLFDAMCERIRPHIKKRMPLLKIFRVLAALFPNDFTTVADRRRLRQLHRAMFPNKADPGPVARHIAVRQRLATVLGSPSAQTEALAERMMLPWLLYDTALTGGEDATEAPTLAAGKAKLIPLPAARRRRGLTATRGYFQTILGVLDFVGEGVTRDELKDHLRTLYPDMKETSLGVIINSLLSEFGVIKRDGDQYQLTDRGASVLESGDPADLSDWLLTRILGIDHVLVELRDHGSQRPRDLLATIQKVNPGWTSPFMPNSLLLWLRSFDVITDTPDNLIDLTEAGREWANRIHWNPEPLLVPDPVVREVRSPTDSAQAAAIELPPFESILEHTAKAGVFPKDLVAKLHAGLWAQRRRHFAILTGLSGSGKTLLARSYAQALTKGAAPNHEHVATVAVPPGWYDPTPLLGYVNPLRGDTYVRTPFLDFLLRASQNPDQPHVVLLDEMNLSHPEQYLAPLLSAMETGGDIDLHREGDQFDGVPDRIRYPENLAIIGTVNMDETTHGLSDKVLDRAFTLEFWHVDLASYPDRGKRPLDAAQEQQVFTILTDLLNALAPARLHFGWRVVDDVLDFVARAVVEDGTLPLNDAVDSIVYAKVVPKLRGDDTPRTQLALEQCVEVLEHHGLKNSSTKVKDLLQDLKATGSARFWR